MQVPTLEHSENIASQDYFKLRYVLLTNNFQIWRETVTTEANRT